MKVILDTNVLISAILAYGPPRDVLDLIVLKHEFILSDYILHELSNKLRTKLKFKEIETKKILSYFEEYGLKINPRDELSFQFSDKKDVPILTLIE